MMLKQYFSKIIPDSVIQEAISDYNNRSEYETSTMSKALPGDSLKRMISYIEKVMNQPIQYCGGNFYKHSIPYFPHTDFKLDAQNDLNVVIPLAYTGQQASLVVFDQAWKKDSVTWCLDHELIEFTVNTGVKGYPCHYSDVTDLTQKPIEENFYQKYLSHHNPECFFGLTGDAYLFEPGSMMIFDNRLIHCTSKFKGEKLGLSLRFKRSGLESIKTLQKI